MPSGKAFFFACFTLILLFFSGSYAQDTITVYDIATKTETYRILPAFANNKPSDSTSASFGAYGVTAMPGTAPVEKIPDSQMSLIKKAEEYYTKYNFPFTAVTSVYYGINITAAVIGRRALLVTNYDVYEPTNKYWRSLTSVNPFYVNGAIQYGFLKLTPVKYYTLNPAVDGEQQNVAIVEVAENIGDYSGYFGLAYDTTAQDLDSLLLYNLSYPESKIYYASYPYAVNGDTLFMKYGYGTPYNANQFHASGGGNGEYVSPYFDEKYRIRGIRWSVTEINKITASDFYFINNVLDSLKTGIGDLPEDKTFAIYPIPATKNVTVQFSRPLATESTLLFTNLLGQTMASYILRKGEIKNEQEISGLPGGVYFVILITGEKKTIGRFVKE